MNIIIVGCGKVGTALVQQLSREGHDIAIIDEIADKVQLISNTYDVLGVVGNGSSFHTLSEAGIDEADLLIAVTNSDELNLLCCVIAKKAGDNVATIARVRNPAYFEEISFIKKELDLSMIINPELAAAMEISRLLRFPTAIEINTFAKGRIELLKFRIENDSRLSGMSLIDIENKFRCGILVCAVERGHEVIIPSGGFVLKMCIRDRMMAAPNEVEDSICRLAQMARAAGMHLVIATQRPSVDVITGIIKANIPSRIAFSVSSQVDSRTILDMGGAEKLLGRGDMLFSPVGTQKPTRIQGCFVSDTEVESVVKYIKNEQETKYDEEIIQEIEKQAVAEKEKGHVQDDSESSDEMLPAAIECVVEAGMASTSLLQRRLRLGYARAGRLIDEMEQRGIVGPHEGSKPRQVLITRQQWLEMNQTTLD